MLWIWINTTTDTVFESTFLAVLAVDWSQTRYIAGKPSIFYATNGFLGQHPTDFDVNGYTAIAAISHVAIALLLPTKLDVPVVGTINPRRWWQVVWIGIEGGYVAHNASMGIKMKW